MSTQVVSPQLQEDRPRVIKSAQLIKTRPG